MYIEVFNIRLIPETSISQGILKVEKKRLFVQNFQQSSHNFASSELFLIFFFCCLDLSPLERPIIVIKKLVIFKDDKTVLNSFIIRKLPGEGNKFFSHRESWISIVPWFFCSIIDLYIQHQQDRYRPERFEKLSNQKKFKTEPISYLYLYDIYTYIFSFYFYFESVSSQLLVWSSLIHQTSLRASLLVHTNREFVFN